MLGLGKSLSMEEPKSASVSPTLSLSTSSTLVSSLSPKITRELSGVSDQLNEIMTQMEIRVEELKMEEAKLEMMRQEKLDMDLLMEENASKAQEVITLDVGGSIYKTSKTTLLNLKGSFFHAMITSGKWNPNSEGIYFIDRRATNFDRILDFLRDGNIDLRGLSEHEVEMIEADIDFYKLRKFYLEESESNESTSSNQPQMVFDSSHCGKDITLSNCGTVCTSSSYSWKGVIGTDHVLRYKCQVLDRGYRGHIMIGFAPKVVESTKRNFHPNGANHNLCGWYLFLNNRSLYSHNGDKGRRYGSMDRIEKGTIIEVIHDPMEQTISYIINGEEQGVAFHHVSGELYPAFDFGDMNSSIQFVL